MLCSNSSLPRAGTLKFLQSLSTRGVCPRNFALSQGKVRVLNQDSHNLVEFDISPDGTLINDPRVTSLASCCGQIICEVPAP